VLLNGFYPVPGPNKLIININFQVGHKKLVIHAGTVFITKIFNDLVQETWATEEIDDFK
jgi:hypothetical protein